MLDLHDYPTLDYARRWSLDTLEKMHDLLESLKRTAPDVITVATSGSLGRLEGMDHSDGDMIVIITDEAASDYEQASNAMQTVWHAITPLDLPMPKASGVYATPASPEQICNHETLGYVADNKDIFGKRLQLLLDARPVYGHEEFSRLRYELLERYAAGFLIHDQRKEWVYLLNDLIRYFRSYCGWHQFDLSNDPVDSWYMRNVKLRNSRIPMFAALLFLLGECSKEKTDKIGWLHAHLDMTVMERLAFVYEQNNDTGFKSIVSAYEYFMTQLNKEEVREQLIKTTPLTLEELYCTRLPEYRDLHENSKTIISELTRFTLARKGQWSDAFFEYLLF